MRLLIVATVATLLASELSGADQWSSFPQKESTFRELFGDNVYCRWTDDQDVLLSLIGRGRAIPQASTSSDALREKLAPFLGVTTVDELVADDSRTVVSPQSVHYEYKQTVSGHVVDNARVIVDVDKNDQLIGLANQSFRELHLIGNTPALSSAQARCFAAAAFLSLSGASCSGQPPQFPPGAESLTMEATSVVYAVPPIAFWAWAIELSSATPFASRRYVIDGTTGIPREMRDRVHRAAHGRVFNPNPFTDPTVHSVADVVFRSQLPFPPYLEVPQLAHLDPPAADGSVRLSGTYVTIVDTQKNLGFPNDEQAAVSPDGNFDAIRGECRFAAVNAYYHIDGSQQRVQDLGFSNVASRKIKVDVRSAPLEFASYYVNNATGTGSIAFGYRNGGDVFQAEDGEVVVHEYAHALQAASALDRYEGEDAFEALAMREGFADYWAMSYFQQAKSPNTLPCMGAWIERASGTSTKLCTREVILSATVAAFTTLHDEHDNGTIWTAALWAIHEKLGRDMADKIILRSHLSVPDKPTFVQGAQAIFTAYQALFPTANHFSDLCTIFVDERKILPSRLDCRVLPPPPPQP